jgi:hypothetical protein
MKTINRDLLTVVKEMPQSDITLDIVTSGNRQFYKYNLSFVIDQIAAYSSGAREMKVEVAYKSVGRTFSLLGGKKFANAAEINRQLLGVNKIRSDFIKQKDDEQKANNILEQQVDIFGRSPKISLFRLRQTGFLDLASVVTEYEQDSNTQSPTTAVAIINDLIKTQPVQGTSNTGPFTHSSITLRGKDPAAQIVPEQAVQDGPRVRSGTMPVRQQPPTIANAFTSQQAQTLSNSNLPNSLKTRVTQRATTDVKLPYTFQIPISSVPPSGKISIICSIRASNGDLVQKIDFVINHAREVRQYGVPRKLPEVSISQVNPTTACVNVFNSDPRVTNIRIYTRDVPTYQSVSEQQRYASVLEISADWRQRATVQRIKFKTGTSKITRFLPVLSNGIVLGNFKTSSFPKPKGVVAGIVVATSNKSVVTVTAYETPASYMYVQFVRRNIDKRQKAWENIGEPVKVGLGVATIIDNTTRSGLTYEYAAILQDKYGNSAQARGTSIVTVSDYTSGTEINVTTKSTAINNGATTTVFNITVTLTKDTDTTALLAATRAQGIDEYFASETKKLSGDLNSITKVNVKRVSKDTGEVKDLGSIEPGEFTDTTTENVVYIFEGLLRSQADLFEETGARKVAPKVFDPKDALQRGNIVSSTLTNTAAISKSNFTQKFLSKKSLLRGTLSYGNTKVMDDEASGFLQGRLGITTTSNVSRAPGTYTISSFELTVGDPGHRLLSFNVQNSNSQKVIDFFVISTLRGGVRSVVGTCHYVDTNIRQNFLDDKTYLTTGVVQYVITPVGYDGITGSEVTSQHFEVV